MKVDLFDQKGKALKKIDLNNEVFGVDVNEKVLSQYVYSYLSNQRQSNAHTKDRSEVRGGGRKPWRQKGTGRARFGSSRNPIWKGGGVAFGPRNDRNFKKKLTKKFKMAAMRSTLSQLASDKRIKVVDKITVKEGAQLTKKVSDIFSKLAEKETKKVLIVTNEVNKLLMDGASNLKNVKISYAGEVNSYDLLTGGLVIIEEALVNALTDTLVNKK